MFLDKLKNITTFIFDVDGVLTDGSVLVTEAGEQLRTFNIKDGYALQLAVKKGYRVCVITGAKGDGVLKRLQGLGITDIFMGAHDKETIYKEYISLHQIDPDAIMYMGDDMPDIDVMQLVGLPVCPADAVSEIKALSSYVSPVLGGKGAARDVIEKVLKVQGNWPTGHADASDGSFKKR